MGLFVMVLAVNRLFDLQGMLTDAMRKVAAAQGWSGRRYGYQIAATFGLLLAVAAGFLVSAIITGRIQQLLLLPLAGVAVLAARVIVLAISWHNADQIMHLRIVGLSASSEIEVIGLVCVAAGVVIAARSAASTNTR